jgi:hypothetical protein
MGRNKQVKHNESNSDSDDEKPAKVIKTQKKVLNKDK